MCVQAHNVLPPPPPNWKSCTHSCSYEFSDDFQILSLGVYNFVGIEVGGLTVFHLSVIMSSVQKKISNSIYVAISPYLCIYYWMYPHCISLYRKKQEQSSLSWCSVPTWVNPRTKDVRERGSEWPLPTATVRLRIFLETPPPQKKNNA